MNIYFIVSAILLFIVSLIHSILGEKRTITPLLNSNLPDSTFKDKSIDWRKKFRVAWHTVTIAWWTIVIIIVDLAIVENSSQLIVNAVAVPFAIMGLFSIIQSKGKHPSVLLLGVAVLLWVGLYL